MGLPSYTRESAQDAGQQRANTTQPDHWHSDDSEFVRPGKCRCSDPADPAPARAPCSADFRLRSCCPPELPPPTVVWATGADSRCGDRGAAAQTLSGFELAPLPDPQRMGDDEQGRDRLPDAPLGCHPPCADLPCGPEAEPVVRACKRARGESAGDWIDAALADEGWWGEEKGLEWSVWGGCFEDSDGPFDPLLVGADAAVQ